MKILTNKNKTNLVLNKKQGLSLVETMAGLLIFTLIFVIVFKAFAPTATTSHNVLRGTTIAMNACNWYLNSLEQAIQYEGALPASDIGKHDITSHFTEELFSDIKLLRGLKVTSEVKTETNQPNLYIATVSFVWGNSDSDSNKSHHFEMSRYIIQPSF